MSSVSRSLDLSSFLRSFQSEEKRDLFSGPGQTVTDAVIIGSLTIPRYLNEYWTARQRQASSLHEISYRACFKPQLPHFFIQLLASEADQLIYDPFSGRGTTFLEAGLMGYLFVSKGINLLLEVFQWFK